MAWTIPANVSAATPILDTTTNAILDDLRVIGASWADYSGTVTLTNITKGNGTVMAKYLRIGAGSGGLVKVRFLFAAGSTTTYSAGNLGVSLPVTPHADYTGGTSSNNVAVGTCIAQPAATRMSATAVITSAGILNFITDGLTASTPVTNTVPAAFGTTGALSFTVEYEPA